MESNELNKRDLDFTIQVDFQGEHCKLNQNYSYKMR